MLDSSPRCAPLAVLALALSLAACAKQATEAAPTPAPSAASSAAAHTLPSQKAYAATPDDRVGILAPGTGVPVGQKIPDVRVADLGGNPIALSSLYEKGPLLIAFYRGGWCPYCNAEIHAFATGYEDYQKRGVTPVAVSVDKPEVAAKIKATYTIPFPVLSDSDAAMIEAFHVAKKVEGVELAKMKGFGVDLEAHSGKAHHEIAIPSLFLVDRGGVVRWAHSDPEYTVRPTTAQILAAIDAAKLTPR